MREVTKDEKQESSEDLDFSEERIPIKPKNSCF